MRLAFRLGLCIGLASALSFGLPAAQTGPSAGFPASRDSLRIPPQNPPVGTGTPSDSAQNPGLGSARNPPASAKNDSLSLLSKSRSDSVIVAKHQFNHREQIITGSVIMTCLALMMVAMNNYNPR
jgi:hypothetical protein